MDDQPLAYAAATGSDDRAFCEKASAALAEGYVLQRVAGDRPSTGRGS